MAYKVANGPESMVGGTRLNIAEQISRAIKLKLVLEYHEHARWPHWQFLDPATGFKRDTAFDVDLLTILNQCERGHSLQAVELWDAKERKLRADPALAQVQALLAAEDKVALDALLDAANSPKPGTQRVAACAFCGVSGGLPCPKMLQKAASLGLKMKNPIGAMLHPGRCRKAVRDLITNAALHKRSNPKV